MNANQRHSPGAHRPPTSTMGWYDYLLILIERGWILATVLAIFLVMGLLEVRKQTPLYRTSARIEVAVPAPKAIASDDVMGHAARDYTYVNTQIKILQSQKLATSSAELALRKEGNPFTPENYTTKRLASEMRGSTSVSQVTGTRMLDVIAVNASPEKAAALANALAEGFIRHNLDRRMESSMEALRWLHKQAEQYKANLEKSELALQEYREKALATALVDRQNIVTEKLHDISSALTEAETSRLLLEAEHAKIRKSRETGMNISALPSIAISPEVISVRETISEKEDLITTLRSRYKDKHPSLQQPLGELKELRRRYQRLCLDAADRLTAEYELAQTREQDLRRALAAQQQLSFDLDRKLLAYNELERNAEADRELYNAILTRMKETSVTGQLQSNDARLVDEAGIPGGPFNLKGRSAVIRRAFLGLLLGAALAFVVHFSDDRIKRTEDVENVLGLPLLTIVSSIRGKTNAERARISHDAPLSPISESFRSMRASLALNPHSRDIRRVMITSASAGAGKSLIASNLAIVLAQNNQKTLLIDADLRRPTVHETSRVRASPLMSLSMAAMVQCGTTSISSGSTPAAALHAFLSGSIAEVTL